MRGKIRTVKIVKGRKGDFVVKLPFCIIDRKKQGKIPTVCRKRRK